MKNISVSSVKKVAVKYQDALILNIVDEIYNVWIKEVPHLDPMQRGHISIEWKLDNIRIMIPEEKYIELH